MTTASELVNDALAIILVDEADITAEDSEIQLGIRFLNDLTAEMEEEGVFFNFTPVINPGDVITSPASANAGLKYSLAPRLAPLFGIPYAPSAEAMKAVSSLSNNFLETPVSRFPGTMPRGSGNRCFNNSRFTYASPLVDASLSRQTSQTTTITTINTPVKVAGTWVVDRAFTFDGTTDGRLTFTGLGKHLAKVEVNFTIQAASSDNFTFYITKNGALLAPGVPVEADETRNVFLQCAEPMVTNDFIEIFVENNSDTTDIVIDQGTFRIT